MVWTWPRIVTVAPGGRSCWVWSSTCWMACGDAAQIAVLGGGIDVEGGLDGVVRHHRIGVFAVDVADAAQDLRRGPAWRR